MTGSWRSARGRVPRARVRSARSTAPPSHEELAAAGLCDRAGHGPGRPVLRDRRVSRGLFARSFSGRHREVARAAERFRAKHGRAPERGELRDLALENRRAKELATRGDLQRVWAQTGERHGFGRGSGGASGRLLRTPRRREQPLEDRIEATLDRARRPCSTPGCCGLSRSSRPRASSARGCGRRGAAGWSRERRVLTLEGGRMTTLRSARRSRRSSAARRAR